jgi:ubiquinone/menaquinone biosynthesis C-methylase UbiE
VLSSVKESYRRILSPAARARIWHVRGRFQQKLGDLSYRLSGFPGMGRNRCNACQGNSIRRFKNPTIKQLLFSFYRCRDCGFIFVAPTPNLSGIREMVMPDFGEGEGVWNAHYLNSINKHTSGKGKLLEIGFGNGSFLKLAQEDGWEVHGSDLAETLARHARQELKLPNIRVGSLEELNYPANFFDVVTGFNFIEHVPNPRKTLEEIRRILRPAGVIALMCPNIAGLYHRLMPETLGDNDPLKITWVPPYHLSYFNKTNFRALLEDVGFAVIGDESHLMSSLWRQFEVSLGPKVTDEKLRQLSAKIQSSSSAKGNARVTEHYTEIKSLLVERMTWTMLSDLMELEAILGAEVGILFVGKKT